MRLAIQREVYPMKTKILAAALAASLISLTGCGTMDRNTAGTVGGAVVGGVVGDAVIGGPAGTLGGAAAGAYIGNKATK
jgi:osmotically inducible lipoprotein OsmB